LVLTVGLAELSFRYVETPIRDGRFARWLRGLAAPTSPAIAYRRRRRFVVGVVLSMLPLFAGFSVATAKDRPTAVEQSLTAAQGDVQDLGELILDAGSGSVATTLPGAPNAIDSSTVAGAVAPTATAAATPGESTVPGAVPVTETTLPPTTVPETTTTTAPPVQPIPMIAIGDSVMLGAAPALTERGVLVDAKVGRQFREGVELVTGLNQQGLLGDVLIVHLGNNGPSTRERFDELMAQAVNVPLVLVLTVKVPKPWEAEVNTEVFDLPNRYPNVRLLDWNGLSQTRDGIFYSDGIHLRPDGQAFYTQLVMDTIAAG
jgi:hypothetical protein